MFEKALDEWFEGDEERITKAVEWYGYSLTTNTSAQKALFCRGMETMANRGTFRFLKNLLVQRMYHMYR